MEAPRNHPLIAAAAAGVLIFSVLGVAVVKDVRHTAAARRDEAAVRPKAEGVETAFESVVRPKVAPDACGDCGVIETIRLVRLAEKTSYRVTLKMDDATMRTLVMPDPPANAVGEQVRLLNGALAARG